MELVLFSAPKLSFYDFFKGESFLKTIIFLFSQGLDSSKPTRYENTMAFMWESQKVWKPTQYALSQLKDKDYSKCWDNVPRRFDPNNAPPKNEPYPFDGKYT